MSVHGIPAFSHIHGRVVWERFQRPLLQGCLMTLNLSLKFVPLCRQSWSLGTNPPFHFSSCPWTSLHRYICGWVSLLIAAPSTLWVHGAGHLQTCNQNPTIKLMTQVCFFCSAASSPPHHQQPRGYFSSVSLYLRVWFPPQLLPQLLINGSLESRCPDN